MILGGEPKAGSAATVSILYVFPKKDVMSNQSS